MIQRTAASSIANPDSSELPTQARNRVGSARRQESVCRLLHVPHLIVRRKPQQPPDSHHHWRVDGKCSSHDVPKSLILAEFCLSLQACGTRSATLQVFDHHRVEHLLLLIVDCSVLRGKPCCRNHVCDGEAAEPAAWILRGSAGACRGLFARKQVVASRMV